MAVFNKGDMYAAIGTMMFSAGSNLAPGGELIMDKSIKDKINRVNLRFDNCSVRLSRIPVVTWACMD